MMVLTGRLWVQLKDRRDFLKALDFRGMTVRDLADAVDRDLAKAARRKGQKPPSTRATIGHLRSGKRNTCQPDTARAIERCLDFPSGYLFADRVSHVSRPQRTAA